MPTLTIQYPTLIDVARRLDPNGSIASVAEILQQYNEMLDDIPQVEGNLPTGHQFTVRTSKPTPSFRLLNQGVVPAKSATGQLAEACAILETRSHIDVDIANLNGNTAAFRLSEDTAFIQGMMDSYANTLINGDTSVNPQRFNGLASRYFSLNTSYTTSANIIDAGGTGTDNTSIWLVGWSPEKVFGIYPKGSKGGLIQEDRGIQDILTDATTNAYMRAYITWFQWKCGLCVKDWRYVVRIANIDISDLETASNTSDSSANIMKFMSMALDKLPPDSNARPVFYANERVRSMLRIKMMDKGNAFLTLEDIMRSSIPRPQKTLTFQGVPVRRMETSVLTVAESRITT